jgi:hypothetical protein
MCISWFAIKILKNKKVEFQNPQTKDPPQL